MCIEWRNYYMALLHSMCHAFGRQKVLIEQRRKYFQGRVAQITDEFNAHVVQAPSDIDVEKLIAAVTSLIHRDQYPLRIEFERRRQMLLYDARDHPLVEAFYRLKPRNSEVS